jgi:hypothetical protein
MRRQVWRDSFNRAVLPTMWRDLFNRATSSAERGCIILSKTISGLIVAS